MSRGLEIRAQIDNEMIRALLLLNGGASVALLAFLSTLLSDSGLLDLSRFILFSLAFYNAGLVFAVIHNRLRRKCSLVHEAHQYAPPPGRFMFIRLRQPRVCFLSIVSMWVSFLLFVSGSITVLIGGFCTLSTIAL